MGTKLKLKKKWDVYLPFFFLACLFVYLSWQLMSLTSMSSWLERNSKVLWRLKDIDGKLLEMRNTARVYDLSPKEPLLPEYQKHKSELERILDELEVIARDTKTGENIDLVKEELAKWYKSEPKFIIQEGSSLTDEDFSHLSSARKRLAFLVNNELEQRNHKQLDFQTRGMRLFFWSTAIMLLLTILFLRHWLRARRWSQDLERREEAYRGMAINATLAEQRFRGLLESAHDLIMITDDKGKIQFVNDQLTQTFGYEKEELIGEPVEVLVLDEYRELHVVQRNNYIKNPVARTMAPGKELFGKRKDGGKVPLEISLSPFRVEGRLQVAAIIRDVSERKNLERRSRWLTELGDIMGRSLDHISLMERVATYSLGKFSDLSSVVCLEGEYLVVGDDCKEEDLHWRSDGTYVTDSIFKLVENRRPFRMETVYQDELNRLPFSVRQKELILRLGLKSAIFCPLMGRDEVLGVIVFASNRPYGRDDFEFIEEVTSKASLYLENARLYELSQKSIRMRDELLRIVSHDLKNPLNSIKLNLHFCQRILNSSQGERTQELPRRLSSMEKSLEHAVKLIRDLLDNAKLETGGLVLRKNLLDPHELIGESENIFRTLAEEKGVRLSVRSHLRDGHKLYADHERLLQVLSNLLGNSIKYTPEGGVVELCLEDEDDGLLLSVSDEGPGISKEKQEHLFEKYWRDEESGSYNLGLGLSLAKGIVEAHGGRIFVDSDQSKGTKIKFILPWYRSGASGLLSLDSSP